MKLTRSTPEIRLVLGGESRIALLPPEVRARAEAKATRRALVGVIVIAVVVTSVGWGYATFNATSSQARLTDAQGRTTTLLAAQTEFVEVRSLQSQLDAVTAAQQVATAYEINWNTYLQQVAAALPADVKLTSVKVTVDTPLERMPAATLPLQGTRVGTVDFEAVSPGLPDLQKWLDALSEMPGFVDATPGTVTSETDGSAYTATVSMHINSDVFSHRFTPIESQDPTSTTTTAEDAK